MIYNRKISLCKLFLFFTSAIFYASIFQSPYAYAKGPPSRLNVKFDQTIQYINKYFDSCEIDNERRYTIAGSKEKLEVTMIFQMSSDGYVARFEFIPVDIDDRNITSTKVGQQYQIHIPMTKKTVKTSFSIFQNSRKTQLDKKLTLITNEYCKVSGITEKIKRAFRHLKLISRDDDPFG